MPSSWPVKRCILCRPATRKGHQGHTRSFGASGSGAFAAGATPPSVDGCCAAGDGASEGSGASNSAGAGVVSSSRRNEAGQPIRVSHCLMRFRSSAPLVWRTSWAQRLPRGSFMHSLQTSWRSAYLP